MENTQFSLFHPNPGRKSVVYRKYTKVKMTFRDGTAERPATPLQGERDVLATLRATAVPEGLCQGSVGLAPGGHQ